LTTNGVIIRQAVSSDIPILMGLDHGFDTDHVWQLSYMTESVEIGVVFREVRLPRPMRVPYPRDPDKLADEWTRKEALLLAEIKESPIAYISLIDGPAQASGWVTDIVVDLRYRKMGVGTQLLNAAKGWCKTRGMNQLFLEMQSKNYPAICLARKNGFAFSGYSDRYYSDQDIVLFFTKAIR